MGKEYDVEAMVARKREIEDQIDRLAQEADELDIALKVLGRFSKADDVASSKMGPSRPEGAPTLFEMTTQVLANAEARGRPGLKGTEIVSEISKEFWPGVTGPQILPTVYRFAKKGRIIKKGNGRFYTAKKNEGTAE